MAGKRDNLVDMRETAGVGQALERRHQVAAGGAGVPFGLLPLEGGTRLGGGEDGGVGRELASGEYHGDG